MQEVTEELPTGGTVWKQFRADLALYRRLRGGERPSGLVRTLWTSRGLWMLLAQRVSRYSSQRRTLVARLAANLGRLYTVFFGKSDLAPTSEIAGGVYLSDRGHLVIGVRSIGAGTLIHDRVTIGRGLADKMKPRIGANVWIGPNCVIYGGIEIGDGATILGGTVVSRNVPAGVVLQGNPPRLVARTWDNAGLRSSLSAYAADLQDAEVSPR